MWSIKQTGWTVISYWKDIWVWVEGVWRTFRKGAEVQVTQIEPQICNVGRLYALTVMTCVLPAGLPRVLLIGQTARPSLRFRHPASHQQSECVLAPSSSCIHIRTFLPNFPRDWFDGKVQYFAINYAAPWIAFQWDNFFFSPSLQTSEI